MAAAMTERWPLRPTEESSQKQLTTCLWKRKTFAVEIFALPDAPLYLWKRNRGFHRRVWRKKAVFTGPRGSFPHNFLLRLLLLPEFSSFLLTKETMEGFPNEIYL